MKCINSNVSITSALRTTLKYEVLVMRIEMRLSTDIFSLF